MATSIDEALAEAVASGAVAGVAAAAWSDGGDYAGAFGQAAPGVAMEIDTPVRIFSMTKAVTAAAVMQLVERGQITLDEPLGDVVPYLAKVEVLDGFGADGTPQLRAPTRLMTLRDLLTHTSGFGYDFADATLARHVPTLGESPANSQAGYEYPLLFDPGTRWSYGIGLDWAGRVVEAVSGQDLDSYFQQHILGPLGMNDTSLYLSTEAQPRLAALNQRGPDGLTALPNESAWSGEVFEMASGGGGLYSTIPDYLRFTRMILDGGELGGVRILARDTVAQMGTDQLGDLSADGWTSTNPGFTADVELLPGQRAGWGLSFMINTQPTAEGRSVGSLAWFGAANSCYWIDRTRRIIGVFATQVLPFFDPQVMSAFSAFEAAVYQTLG
jgi:methyl acetate hydrolase